MKKISLILIVVLMLSSLVSCNFTGPGSGKLGDYKVKIDSVKMTKDLDGKDAVIITYIWANNSNNDSAFYFTISRKISQNGVKCDETIMPNDANYLGADAVKSIKPGQTLKVQLAYALQDTKTPIDVELQEAANTSADAPKVTRTFNIG